MSTEFLLNRPPRILLADDHPQMLKAVANLLTPHFDVVAAVSNGKRALEAVVQTDPDVLLLDIAMPELDGLRTARELRQKNSRAKVVFLSGLEGDDYISEALDVGARGFIVKRRLQTDLLTALNLVVAGQLFISPHGFAGTQKRETDKHILEFYSDEITLSGRSDKPGRKRTNNSLEIR